MFLLNISTTQTLIDSRKCIQKGSPLVTSQGENGSQLADGSGGVHLLETVHPFGWNYQPHSLGHQLQTALICICLSAVRLVFELTLIFWVHF